MRVYLVIIDESQEAHGALRFAARRAADTAGAVHLLALVPKQDFSAFGAVQATIEEEARDRAEVLANSAAGELMSESGLMPQITVVMGDSKTLIDAYLKEHPEVAALLAITSARSRASSSMVAWTPPKALNACLGTSASRCTAPSVSAARRAAKRSALCVSSLSSMTTRISSHPSACCWSRKAITSAPSRMAPRPSPP